MNERVQKIHTIFRFSREEYAHLSPFMSELRPNGYRLLNGIYTTQLGILRNQIYANTDQTFFVLVFAHDIHHFEDMVREAFEINSTQLFFHSYVENLFDRNNENLCANV